MENLSWLSEGSVDDLRTALSTVMPASAHRSVIMNPRVDQSDPLWASSSAVVDDTVVVKFAWSKVAAERLWHEAQILQTLIRETPGGLRLPDLVATSRDPVLVVTRLVPGRPLTYDMVGALAPSGVDRIAEEVASFLSHLHRPHLLTRALDALGGLSAPTPQATTAGLRDGLPTYLRADQHGQLLTWCDWTDSALSVSGDSVLVHGDLHGHNQVWSVDDLRLEVVVDFETSAMAEPEYDFRYLPAQGPGVDLLLATASRYESKTGRALALDRIMAWHVRTALGDALWRSDAHVPLPGGGSPADWMDELAVRLDALDLQS
jgi:hypothetical protein